VRLRTNRLYRRRGLLNRGRPVAAMHILALDDEPPVLFIHCTAYSFTQTSVFARTRQCLCFDSLKHSRNASFNPRGGGSLSNRRRRGNVRLELPVRETTTLDPVSNRPHVARPGEHRIAGGTSARGGGRLNCHNGTSAFGAKTSRSLSAAGASALGPI
jgi:hypothetical protein